MRLADNVFVHDPEINLGRIDSNRLRAHGWPKDVIELEQQRSQQAPIDLPAEIPDVVPKAD